MKKFNISVVLTLFVLVLCLPFASCYIEDLDPPSEILEIPADDNDLLDLIDEYDALVEDLYQKLLKATDDAAAGYTGPNGAELIAAFYAARDAWNEAVAKLEVLEDEARKRKLFGEPTPEQQILIDAVIAAREKKAKCDEQVTLATERRDLANEARDAFQAWFDTQNPTTQAMMQVTLDRLKDDANLAAASRTGWMTAQNEAGKEVTAAEEACKASGARLPKK